LGASKLGFVLPPPLPSLQLLFVASLQQFLEQTLFGELGGSTFEVSKCVLLAEVLCLRFLLGFQGFQNFVAGIHDALQEVILIWSTSPQISRFEALKFNQVYTGSLRGLE
jgi:hypothetical protein